MSILLWILARLKEPSTYAGFATIVAALGWNVTDEMQKTIMTAVMGVAGMLAMFFSERPKSGS